jgi:hypothetical protein
MVCCLERVRVQLVRCGNRALEQRSDHAGRRNHEQSPVSGSHFGGAGAANENSSCVSKKHSCDFKINQNHIFEQTRKEFSPMRPVTIFTSLLAQLSVVSPLLECSSKVGNLLHE